MFLSFSSPGASLCDPDTVSRFLHRGSSPVSLHLPRSAGSVESRGQLRHKWLIFHIDYYALAISIRRVHAQCRKKYTCKEMLHVARVDVDVVETSPFTY